MRRRKENPIPISYMSIPEYSKHIGLGINRTRDVVKKSGSGRRVGKRVLVNVDVADGFIEKCKINDDENEDENAD